MKILFISRVHPPVLGGLENQSYNLINNFKKINKLTYSIVNTKGKKALPWFIPFSFFKALNLIKKEKITHLHLSDGLLALEGLFLKKLTGVKTSITIHGLDITYKNKAYQKIIPKTINKLDNIICISKNTKNECIKRGISKNKISIIPNGVNTNEFLINQPKEKLRRKLSKKINVNLKDKKILLTTGRLVKRKGVNWFVNNVMNKLPKGYVYLISGDGKDKEKIKESIKSNNLENKVFLLGKTDKNLLKLLYNTSDFFIMPNIKVKGDVEGFGLVAIEAGSCGLPVIASKVDGIEEAIIDGKTGNFVKEKDINGFINKISRSKLNRKKIQRYVKKNFDWKKIVKTYKEVMK